VRRTQVCFQRPLKPPDNLSWWYKVQCTPSFDYLSFSVPSFSLLSLHTNFRNFNNSKMGQTWGKIFPPTPQFTEKNLPDQTGKVRCHASNPPIDVDAEAGADHRRSSSSLAPPVVLAKNSPKSSTPTMQKSTSPRVPPRRRNGQSSPSRQTSPNPKANWSTSTSISMT
jgi:hypothetical protein